MALFLYFTGLIWVAGCEHNQQESTSLQIPTVREEDITIRSAPWFIGNPGDVSEVQHNQVVNLIIDRKWDFQMSDQRIFFHIIRQGEGEQISWGDQISVHYTGYDVELRPFDSSRSRKTPFNFYVGNVIKGWNEGLTLVKEGGRVILLIPSYKAYDDEGFRDLVAPGQHLIFDVEILAKSND